MEDGGTNGAESNGGRTEKAPTQSRNVSLLFVFRILVAGVTLLYFPSGYFRIARAPYRDETSRFPRLEQCVGEWLFQEGRILEHDDQPHGVFIDEVIVLGDFLPH
jgi:hypothetical protein